MDPQTPDSIGKEESTLKKEQTEVLKKPRTNYNLPTFNWNLSYLLVVWKLTFYPSKVWLKFKLPICGLKSHDVSVLLDSFLSCIFMFSVFLEERDKVKQNYIFNHVFNKIGLQNSNWANFMWIKCQISNRR